MALFVACLFGLSVAGLAYFGGRVLIDRLTGWCRSGIHSLRERLEGVSVSVSAHRLVLGMTATALLGGLLAWTLFGAAWLFLPGAALGSALPWGWVRRLERLRAERFSRQLVDCLDLLAGSLRAGQSLSQALTILGTEAPQPSASEWGMAAGEVQLGRPVEEALERMAARLAQSPCAADLGMLSTAVAVNRGVGGNLAEILSGLTATLRERERLRGQVAALTAQGRLSGWVVGLLPLGLLLAMQMIDPELVRPLLHTPVGWILLGLCLALEISGGLIIRRIVDIRV